VVITGEMGRRRLVARQQKNPISADAPTIIAGGTPTWIFKTATKSAISPSASA